MPRLYLFLALLVVNYSLLFAQTKNDKLQIKEAVLNYLEGLEYNE